jgi:RecA-family ATPase
MNTNPDNFLEDKGVMQRIAAKDNLPSGEKLFAVKNKNFSFICVKRLKQKIKPVQWLIKDYMEEHTNALMFGDPACGKSFLAIDMACCVASGTNWHGQAAKQGAVFYIAGEGHNGLGRRIKAWEQHNGVCLDDMPLYFAERAAQLYDSESAEAVADAVQQIADLNDITPRLIIIDTLARNFGGGDENSTQAMNVFIQNIDEIKNRWNATVLIVHHTGHGDKNRARGAMSMKAALDYEYQIQKNADGVISFACVNPHLGVQF